MVTSKKHQDVNCGMKLNSENNFGHVNSSRIEFNPDISENSKHSDEAGGSSRKGKWSTEEDNILIRFVEESGTKKGNGKVEVNWGVIARKLNRTYKSCRLRWYNQLAPGISFERFSPYEDDLIIRMVREIGPMWSKIAEMLNCRTDNQVKNRWNSALKKLQGQKLSEKVISRKGIRTLKHVAKSTHGNMNGNCSSPSSNSNLLLIPNATSAGAVAQVPPASLHVLHPFPPDGSLFCHLSSAFDTPDPAAPYASPDPASTFDWLYSPSLHPPGCEIPDDTYPDYYPGISTFNPTQERQCAPFGGITAMEPEPEKPASDLSGFDWLNLL